MATAVSIAIRKADAIERIGKALGVDTYVQGRDADLNDAVRLERIAEAAEAQAKDVAKVAAANRKLTKAAKEDK